MSDERYAHSKEGAPKSEWHTLRAHLEAVAELASARAAKWGAGDWGRYAGLSELNQSLYSSEYRRLDAAVAGGAEYDARIWLASPRLRRDAFQVIGPPREDKVSIHFRKRKKNSMRS